MHDQHEWLRDDGAIFKEFDESQILFPAGSARRVREILPELNDLRAEVAAGRDELDDVRAKGGGSRSGAQAATRRMGASLPARSARADA